MSRFLCFTLEGPFASWGDIAPGEQRTSWTRPSKSAALGLVAAALGVKRTEESRLAALHDTLGFAVLAEQIGLPMTEFQTEQRPTSPGLNRFRKAYGRVPATRGESLEIDDIATSISRRSFFISARHRVALWVKGKAPEDLDAIAAALERPVFSLFLGRRAYAPSRPLAPQVMEAETLEGALVSYLEVDRARLALVQAKRGRWTPTMSDQPRHVDLWCDADPCPPLQSNDFAETNTRRDAYRASAPRMFVERLEGRVVFEMPPENRDGSSAEETAA
jgi:CRISPR system Cascade subunit CasD